MNESEKRLIRAMFPNGSESFFKANIGLRASVTEQDVRPTVVHTAPGKAKSDARPRVSIVLYRVRLLDKDNAYGATKVLTDCLRKVDLIPGDSTEDIDLEVEQRQVPKRVDQHTEIRIDYP